MGEEGGAGYRTAEILETGFSAGFKPPGKDFAAKVFSSTPGWSIIFKND
jgi:hypothetical protein